MAYRQVADPVSGAARDDLIERANDALFIPADPDNADWQAYQAWLAEGNEPAEPEPQNRSGQVDAERDRRLPLGVIYQGRLFQTRSFDVENLSGAATAAVAALAQGAQPGDLRWADPDADFGWIAADNTLVPMDAPTLFGLARAAMARRSAIILAGREIKDRLAAEPSLDITDDALWPA